MLSPIKKKAKPINVNQKNINTYHEFISGSPIKGTPTKGTPIRGTPIRGTP